MTKTKFKQIIRPATKAEKLRHAAVRKKVMQEFPPIAAAPKKKMAHSANH